MEVAGDRSQHNMVEPHFSDCEEETRRIEELTRWKKETGASSLGQVQRRPEKKEQRAECQREGTAHGRERYLETNSIYPIPPPIARISLYYNIISFYFFFK